MAINKAKVQAQAQKYILKGQLDKAINEYLTILNDDPDDMKICQRLGDLYAKKGDKAGAREYYERIAGDYADKGFYLKAIAVYKQIMRLWPDQIDLKLKLADLYHRQGLPAEAMSQYRLVAGYYEKKGQVAAALEVIRKIADLDSSNIMIRVKLAENFIKEGLKEKALEEILKVGEELKKQGKTYDLVKLFERFLLSVKSNKSILRELGSAYLETGDEEKALERMSEALKADPDDLGTLKSLAYIYRKRGEKDKAKSSFQQILRMDPNDVGVRIDLAESYLEDGSLEKAVSEYEMVIDLYLRDESFDEALKIINDLKEKYPGEERILGKLCEIYWIMKDEENLILSYKELARLYAKKGDRDKSSEIYKRVLDLRPDDEEALQEAGVRAPGKEVETVTSESPVETGKPLSGSEIKKLLTEVEVHIKYGMEDKAEQTMKQILACNPESIETHIQLKNLYKRLERDQDAVEELMDIVGIYKDLGENDKAAQYLKEVIEIDPGHKEASEMYASVMGKVPAGEVNVRVEAEQEEVEEFPIEIELEVEDHFGEGAGEPESDTLETEEEIIEEIVPIEEEEEEAASAVEAVEAKQGERSEFVQRSVADLGEMIEEADFYIQQELYDKARTVLESALEIEPEHAEASKRIERITALEEAENEVRAVSKVEETPEEYFDLTTEIVSDIQSPASAEEGGELLGFDALFESFKEGVERQVSAEDSDTHYNLGIAYKEMGLFDDAMTEFMKAMKDPSKVFDAYSMLGLCCLDKRLPNEAIEYFLTGLETEGITKEAQMNLSYELGLAYKKANMAKEAREVLGKIYNSDKTFRNINQEFEELGSSGTDSPSGGNNDMETVSEKDMDGNSRAKDKISYI